ncbi:hypothetical protein HanPI659440_Chr05g0187901 [Helianthus annuus]|nr:hypothetical protein HanPI659440_Chr05g0187901 [Helianthus annuus]
MNTPFPLLLHQSEHHHHRPVEVRRRYTERRERERNKMKEKSRPRERELGGPRFGPPVGPFTRWSVLEVQLSKIVSDEFFGDGGGRWRYGRRNNGSSGDDSGDKGGVLFQFGC